VTEPSGASAVFRIERRDGTAVVTCDNATDWRVSVVGGETVSAIDGRAEVRL
jgi:hypothetical protein